MERVPVVLTGRIGAIAWRLAGARVRVVAGVDGAAAFDAACASAPLVLVDEAVAATLPRARLAAARRGHRPLVLVVPSPERDVSPGAGAGTGSGTSPNTNTSTSTSTSTSTMAEAAPARGAEPREDGAAAARAAARDRAPDVVDVVRRALGVAT